MPKATSNILMAEMSKRRTMISRHPMAKAARQPLSLLWPALRAAAISLLGAFQASAQPDQVRCLKPEAPMTALSETVLAEYRAEIAADFEADFGAVSDYIACIDDERARALAEALMATNAYSTLLNATPTRKDRP